MKALLDEAKTDLARYQKLLTEDSIARQQAEDQVYVVHQDEGTVKLDQAALETAKLNLAYCHITAPIAGRVGLRLVDPGNYITGSSSTGTCRRHDDQADDGRVHGRPERSRPSQRALPHGGREIAGDRLYK